QLPIGELIPSLTRIQHGDVSGMVDGNMALAATVIEPGITNVLRQLKGSSLASGLGQTEGMTLDIVIMLFDQIFDDSKITSAMKGLIGRLQIPVLKVAILDKTFFSKKTHPARKLLNVMGELAISLPEDFGSSSPLYVELDRIVQRLIDTFQDNLDVFDELRQELERVSAQEANRSIEGARHLAAAVEQRERLGMAHAVAQHAIRLRVESRKLPQVVVRFLAEQWVKLLIVAYAKHGAESDAYKTATTTMDLLIWSVSPMQSLEERRKLAARLPGLLKRLDYGLQLIGASEEVRKHFFAKLMRCHTKIINSPTDQTSVASSHPSTAHSSTPMHGGHDNSESAIESAAHAPVASLPVLTEVAESSAPIAANTPAHAPSREAVSQPSAAEAASSEPPDDTEPQESSATFSAVTIPNPFGEGEIEVEEIDLADLPGNNSADLPTTAPSNPAASDENSRMVSGLQEGAWVEFRDREDNITIARLSYISPLKGTYLFVNRKGRKVGEYSLYQLAREFRSGTAALMDSSPLFDRAMTNVVGALKKTAP
ncbi:MAG TPA: DUF1631 family protein, partial [Burkholderiales bacterium]|nr:DUF1631 family protein [Burkholderiales bacterium]